MGVETRRSAASKGNPAAATPAEVEFDNIINFRDAGKTVNEFLGKKLVREGQLFRSARPDDATLDDRQRLQEHYGIQSIMDLRTKTEHLNKAKKRDADLKIPALLQSNAALAEPLQMPGMNYLEIKLTGRSFEKFLMSQLSWLSFFKFLFLFICGYRMQAIAIMGREVMLPRGLVGLGLATIDQSGLEIKEALSSLLTPTGLPILVHCTQGKDRTGIIITLVLMILGVPAKAISHDYSLSDSGLAAEKEARLEEIREIGLTDDWGDTAPGFVEGIEKHLKTTYGGLDNYLDGIGFVESQREKLRELLLY